MKPLEIATRFAAFAWYTGYSQEPRPTLQAEARRFAKENWRTFLPVAHAGWGRLLLRVAKVRPTTPPKHHRETAARPARRKLAVV
jgi:hypothetical protein